MIIGAHSILYSRKAEADREFLSHVIGLPSVDVGGGWLIFGLPPSEVAVHPSRRSGRHEFYLLCDKIEDFILDMKKQNVRCSRAQQLTWGYLTRITLPGGGKLGVYQPLHKRPKSPRTGRRNRSSKSGRK